MSAASLIAIATGLSTGTTLITGTALAAVAAALALRGFSLLRAATAALLSFGTTLVLSAALLSFGTTLVLSAALVLLLAGSCLLTAGARAFFTSATLIIGSTVAGCITTAAVLAGADFLFSAFAVGLLAALGSILAASCRLASTESIYILLDSAEHHFANTLGGQGRTSDTIDLSLGFAGTFLHYGEGHLAICHHGTTDELALELLFLDEGTETGGLALMVEVSTEHRLEVGRYGYITPKATPKATAFQRQHEGICAIGGLCLIDRELLAYLLGLDLKGSTFRDLTIGSDNTCFLNQFVELCFHLALVDTTNVEGSKNLFLLVDSHIGILSGLQGAADEGQQEGYEHHHHCCIADGVYVSIGVNALRFHLRKM